MLWICHCSPIISLIYCLLYFEKTLMGNMTLTGQSGLLLENTSYFNKVKMGGLSRKSVSSLKVVELYRTCSIFKLISLDYNRSFILI